MVKIFIDPGHGGNDPGAMGNGLKEKDVTLKISKKMEEMLKKYEDVQVKLSRTKDVTLSLAQRTQMANDWKADYLLSVHVNAGGGTGYEDYMYNGKVPSLTARFRDYIHDEIVKEVSGVKNRGKKRANFHMLRESKMPAMLTENLFLDTKADAILLGSDSFLERIALGHVNGLIRAFGLKKKQPLALSKPPMNKNRFYRVIAGSYNDRANAYKQADKLKKLGIDDVFIDVFDK